MPSIKDFFSKAQPKSADPMSSPNKGKLEEKDPSSTPGPQKLRRSTKTMVKSKTQMTLPMSAAPKSKAASPKKAVVASTEPIVIDSDEEAFEERPPKTKAESSEIASPKKAPVSSPKKPDPVYEQEEKAMEKEEKNTPVKKFKYYSQISAQDLLFSYREFLARKNTAPVALGSKEIPEGAPNCLAGLAFLFTGDLSALTRDTATDLVKRFGGRVVSAPSGKVNYVVAGENAGPAKMQKVEALGLKVINEDGFLDLIRNSKSSDEQPAAVKATATPAKPKAPSKAKPATKPNVSKLPGSDLWTVKYAPQRREDLIGNAGLYDKLVEWLRSWTPSKDSKQMKAVLLSGPPGIGKTTMAGLACRELGYDPIEFNASDTRNKKALHLTVGELIDSCSLTNKKQVLIMDECDGMSAGDRGGMAELILLIKRTRIPIICICNDRSSIKVRSLANYCLDLRLRRPDARMAVSRLKAIAEAEGLTSVEPNAIEELLNATHGDLRQVLTLLSTFKLKGGDLSFDAGKSLASGSGKDIDQGPFDSVSSLFGHSSWMRMSLNEKLDKYFIDGSLVPLMIHENYLRCKASTPRQIVSQRNDKPNFIELCAAAADSLSLSDRADSLIRGANQEWSLAPLHGMLSTVIPAYYVFGQLSGRIDFAGWLGQNSRQGKHQRLLGELAKHTFLHTHVSSKPVLRLDYLPTLADGLLSPMRANGQAGIDSTIGLMDAYSLSRDDLDSLLELLIDPSLNTEAFSKIPTTVRSAFTRKYNQGVHRLPYSLGGAVSSVKRIAVDIATGEDEEAEEYVASDDDEEEASNPDVSKDKNIKVKPAGKATKPAAKKLKN